MTDLDVERIVEAEVEQLKQDIKKLRNTAVVHEKFHQHAVDIMEVYEKLVDALELRIEQLKDKIDSYNMNDDRPLHHSFGAENND